MTTKTATAPIRVTPALGARIRETATDDARMAAESRAYERECGASFTTGGPDPYGTGCELDKGHEPPHVGPDPFGTGDNVSWTGGGMCAGDPLPIHNVRFTRAPAKVRG